MRCKPTVYLIGYGAVDVHLQALLVSFVQNLGGSLYLNILSTYYDLAGYASNALTYGGWVQYTDAYGNAYGLGNYLSASSLESIVNEMLAVNAMPTDSNAIYLVILPDDVGYSGFCYESCG